MKHVKVIIGAGFGDEGKGLASAWFSKKHLNAGDRVVNVLYNGGAQRGHTANDHVYHCFGAGSALGAHTHCDRNFFFDPFAASLESKSLPPVSMTIHPDCRLVLPCDIALNQAVERIRNRHRHGSCGMGIYEAWLRSKHEPFRITAADMQCETLLRSKYESIRRDYLPIRYEQIKKELGVIPSPECFDEEKFFSSSVKAARSYPLSDIPDCDTLVFEGGQGLLLDWNNFAYHPFLTPSRTGSAYLAEFINSLPRSVDVEVCYVSRTYMTRHGAGRFDTECRKEDINPDIVDQTNGFNEFQQDFRFGWYDPELIHEHIRRDLAHYCRPVTKSMLFTHCNYTNWWLACKDGFSPIHKPDFIDRLYISAAKDTIRKMV